MIDDMVLCVEEYAKYEKTQILKLKLQNIDRKLLPEISQPFNEAMGPKSLFLSVLLLK